jgi:hypothetical protein
MSTEAQLAANRANSKLSTGPTTETGRTASSLNALKSGLTGRTVLLPTDDLALFEAHVAALTAEYQPVGPEESGLVQSIADHEWRLNRAREIEFGIFAMGHIEFADLYASEPETLRSCLIKTKTFLAYQRQLNNLSIQENRLSRRRDKDIAALNETQELRWKEEDQAADAWAPPPSADAPQKPKRQWGQHSENDEKRLDEAAHSLIAALNAGTFQSWEPEQFGFEFSKLEVADRAVEIRRAAKAETDDQAA